MIMLRDNVEKDTLKCRMEAFYVDNQNIIFLPNLNVSFDDCKPQVLKNRMKAFYVDDQNAIFLPNLNVLFDDCKPQVLKNQILRQQYNNLYCIGRKRELKNWARRRCGNNINYGVKWVSNALEGK